VWIEEAVPVKVADLLRNRRGVKALIFLHKYSPDSVVGSGDRADLRLSAFLFNR